METPPSLTPSSLNPPLPSPTFDRRRLQRLLPLLLAALLTGGTLTLAAWPSASSSPTLAKPSFRVHTSQVTHQSEHRSLRVAGVTRPKHHALLAFSIPARLVSRPVNVGDRVKKGQLLASLDPRQFQNARSGAQAALADVELRLAQARRDLARVEKLHGANALSDSELEQTRLMVNALTAGKNAAHAQLRDAERLAAEAVLRAPFDGYATAIALQPGEMAAPGHPIIELSGDGPVQLHAEVPESAVAQLEEGLAVVVHLPMAAEQKVQGTITSVARAAMGPGRLFPVVVDIHPSEQIRAGMTAEVILPLRGAQRFTIPVEAVLNPGSSQPFVFVVRDCRAVRVDVKLGSLVTRQRLGDVTVDGELSDGDLVIIAGHGALADGDIVELVP